MKNVTKILCVLSLFIIPTFTFAADSISGSASQTAANGVALPITDIQITSTSTGSIPVKLLVTNGSLQMSVTSGITFDGATTGSTIYFSGTLANINAALASLTYTRSGTGSDTLEVSLVNRGEVFFEGSSHLYQYIAFLGTWQQAVVDAATKSMYGAQGYLTTITSQAENDFVAARLTNAGWMGASDVASEGDWKWVTGPESGTSFWSGTGTGGTVGGMYANWSGAEPNDSSSNEDCAQFLTGGSGSWNDLPCTVTTLPGYVVEFGTTGALPSVAAKSVTITTINAPTLSSISPTDNATGTVPNINLTLTFSEVISTSTGNIVIRKVSDNTIFESVDVAGTRVSKTSSTIVVIDPTANFSEQESYYITIPNTAFKNGSNVFYAGISASSTWNFTIGDFTPPVIASVASTTSSSTATVTWTTNEIASSKVYFGPTATLGASTTLQDISPRVTSHSVALTGLPACTTYFYTVQSTDASSNTATYATSTFVTSGCSGTTPPMTATSSSVTSTVGGSQTLTTPSNTITVTTPPNFTATSSSVAIQVQALVGTEVHAALGKPTAAMNKVGAVVFDVKAIIDGTTVLDSFDQPVTITYTYTDLDVSALDESSLWLYHYHNNAWSRLDSCSINGSTNTITCTTPSFSIFSLFGQVKTNATISGPQYGGTVYGCKDSNATNYSYFSTHDQKLCTYAKANTTVTTQTVSTPSAFTFTKNLSMGIVHADVKVLQQYLNAKGFTVALTGPGSKGNETTRFGVATKNALIKYQKAMKINPAIGYFGAVTRASVK